MLAPAPMVTEATGVPLHPDGTLLWHDLTLLEIRTLGEWVKQQGAWAEDYYGCLEWPRPVHQAAPVPSDAQPLPRSIPVLVLAGDLDNRTPRSEAEKLTPTLGATVRLVTLRNTTHVLGEGEGVRFTPTNCARKIIRDFLSAPRRVEEAYAAAASPPRLPPPPWSSFSWTAFGLSRMQRWTGPGAGG